MPSLAAYPVRTANPACFSRGRSMVFAAFDAVLRGPSLRFISYETSLASAPDQCTHAPPSRASAAKWCACRCAACAAPMAHQSGCAVCGGRRGLVGDFANGGRLYDHSRRPGPSTHSTHPHACSGRAFCHARLTPPVRPAVASSASHQPARATEERVLNVRHARSVSLRGHSIYRAAPPTHWHAVCAHQAGARLLLARGCPWGALTHAACRRG